jgi:hypothetical protein
MDRRRKVELFEEIRRGYAAGGLIGIGITFLCAALAFFIGTGPTALVALAIGMIIPLIVVFVRDAVKRKELFDFVFQFFRIGFIGGVVGLLSQVLTLAAYASPFGHLGFIFYYICPHVLFKIGLRFVHPQIFDKKYLFLEREVLVSLYAYPVALFNFGVSNGPTLNSLVTGSFLIEAHDLSLKVSYYRVAEVVFGILLSLAFYGYGIAMALQGGEDLDPPVRDNIISGIGTGVLITSGAYFMYRFGGFPTTVHKPTSEEIANCFLFNAILATAVFDAYRRRRDYALHKESPRENPRRF